MHSFWRLNLQRCEVRWSNLEATAARRGHAVQLYSTWRSLYVTHMSESELINRVNTVERQFYSYEQVWAGTFRSYLIVHHYENENDYWKRSSLRSCKIVAHYMTIILNDLLNSVIMSYVIADIFNFYSGELAWIIFYSNNLLNFAKSVKGTGVFTVVCFSGEFISIAVTLVSRQFLDRGRRDCNPGPFFNHGISGL